MGARAWAIVTSAGAFPGPADGRTTRGPSADVAQQVGHGRGLGLELDDVRGQAILRVPVEVEVVDDRPGRTVIGPHREAEDQAPRDAVAAVGDHPRAESPAE